MAILDLKESIERYPLLKACLGEEWINNEAAVDPVTSRFALARWLRLPGYERTLEILEGILDRLHDQAGMADRRRSIRNDPDSFRETQCELYVANWLTDLGYRFDMPGNGPDFDIRIGSGFIPLEVTVPRRIAWRDDVRDRLHLLAILENVHFDLAFTDDPAPKDIPPGQAISSILDSAIELIQSMRSTENQSTSANIPDLFLTLTVSALIDHHITTSSTYAAAIQFGAFVLAAKAARIKADQFVNGAPNILLVGVDQMTDEDTMEFLISFNAPQSDIPIDWSELPRDLAHLLVVSFPGAAGTPDPGRWLTNPLCPHTPTPEALGLLRAMFPVPLPDDEPDAIDR